MTDEDEFSAPEPSRFSFPFDGFGNSHHDHRFATLDEYFRPHGKSVFMANLLQPLPINPGELRDGDLRLELVRFAPHEVHKVPAYHFRMVHAETGEELGAINLRISFSPHIERYAGHVGYAVHLQHRGHSYAARALRLLLPLASQLQINPLWITCDPENKASQRTLELVGARFVEEVAVPADCVIFRSGKTRKYRYRLSIS